MKNKEDEVQRRNEVLEKVEEQDEEEVMLEEERKGEDRGGKEVDEGKTNRTRYRKMTGSHW